MQTHKHLLNSTVLKNQRYKSKTKPLSTFVFVIIYSVPKYFQGVQPGWQNIVMKCSLGGTFKYLLLIVYSCYLLKILFYLY